MYINKEFVENQRNQAIQFISKFEEIENIVETHSENHQKGEFLELLKELRNSSLKLGSNMLKEVVENSMTDLVVDNSYQGNKLLVEVVEEICKSLKDFVEE